jgi:NAD(P)-dependent dehydrogenase (short-subunit alcohol dehydrogenase family)
MTIRFDDRVVIVTGGARGLGRAHALGFAASGAAVVVNDLGEAETIADEIRASGGRAIADAGDVADSAAMEAMVARALSAFGRVDVLVANAGILRDRSIAKMSEEEWAAVRRVHLDAAFAGVKAVWPVMKAAGYGRIVLTTSSSGLYGNFGQANYAAAKMGLVGLAATLAIEGAKDGIRVNAIAPVATTRMTEALFPPGSTEVFAPEKVTPGVLFLASERAPTGVVLAAGGGAFARVQVVESAGVVPAAGVASADEVAAAWEAISDMAGATTIPSSPLQTLKFFELATRAR